MQTKKKRKTIDEELNEFVDSIQVSNAEEENNKTSEESNDKNKDLYYILSIFTPQQIIDWLFSMEEIEYYYEKDKYTNEIEITIVAKIY